MPISAIIFYVIGFFSVFFLAYVVLRFFKKDASIPERKKNVTMLFAGLIVMAIAFNLGAYFESPDDYWLTNTLQSTT
jgi:hypothetical protein